MGEKDRTFEDLKKDYPEKIEKLDEALDNFGSEYDPNVLKTKFPDKWKYLYEKLAYPCE